MSFPERAVQDFLQKTEEFLQDMPQSERQAALEDWRQSLRAYGEAHPSADFVRLKRLLGGPRGLANLLRVKGRLPLKGSLVRTTRQVVAWIAVAGLTGVLLVAGLVWWKFTPFLEVGRDRVQVLGGLIDIDGQLGQVKVGDQFEFSDAQFKNVFEGSYELPSEVEDLVVEFDRGQMEFTYTNDNRLTWNCKVSSEPSDGFIKQEKEAMVVQLKGLGGADCAFKLPSRLKYTVDGDAGKIDVIAPANDTFVRLGSGVVNVAPDSELHYRFDLRVGQGSVDPAFERLSQQDGIEIKVDVGTGNVQKK